MGGGADMKYETIRYDPKFKGSMQRVPGGREGEREKRGALACGVWKP